MSILSSSNALKFSYDLSVNSIATNQELMRRRPQYNEKLAKAFEELITIAQVVETMSASVDSLAESGLTFVSARSSFHDELAKAMANLENTRLSDSDGSVDGEVDKLEEILDEKAPLVPRL